MKPTMMCLMVVASLGCVEPVTKDPVEGRNESTCVANVLEEDSMVVVGVGAPDGPPEWGVLPPTAIAASTYLRLQDTPVAGARFQELNRDIAQALMTSPGLMGVSIRASAACNTARTLTVWASEEAMMGFVMSPAHITAMGATPEISRGGSITSTWGLDSLEEMSWRGVLPGFVGHEGPVY